MINKKTRSGPSSLVLEVKKVMGCWRWITSTPHNSPISPNFPFIPLKKEEECEYHGLTREQTIPVTTQEHPAAKLGAFLCALSLKALLGVFCRNIIK
ncbi:hypothetical protein [Anoxynatronum sibiricum]|uniref:hypothetical protein n=1 Tax=Anoxynatronum sibiricum TaxID=210623 RepID=UPI0031B89F73